MTPEHNSINHHSSRLWKPVLNHIKPHSTSWITISACETLVKLPCFTMFHHFSPCFTIFHHPKVPVFFQPILHGEVVDSPQHGQSFFGTFQRCIEVTRLSALATIDLQRGENMWKICGKIWEIDRGIIRYICIYIYNYIYIYDYIYIYHYISDW